MKIVSIGKWGARLQREFHISEAEYKAVLAYQGNRCAGCKRPVTDFKTRLAVDHCHKSGLVRGLLCWHCNRALGSFRDTPESAARFRALADYLDNPPFTVVLGTPRYTAPGKLGSKARSKVLAKMKKESS